MSIAARPVGSLDAPVTAPPTAGRRPELDLLRALVVVGLIVFHSAMVFADFDWFVQNGSTNVGFAIFTLWGALWGMPLLFLVSGMGVWYSLRTRSGLGFIKERTARLLVPYVVGEALLVAPMFYIGLLGEPGFHESYGAFWLHFLDFRPALRHLPFLNEWTTHGHVVDQAHLWFLYYLFLYSLVLLPVFLWLRGERGRRFLGRAGRLIAHRWAVFVLAVPIVLVEASLRTGDNTGGWNPAVYVFPLLYGFVIAADRRFEAAMRRDRRVALVTAVVVTLGFIFLTGLLTEDGGKPMNEGGMGTVWRALQGLTSWLWIVAIMGYASAFMARGGSGPPTSPNAGTGRMQRVSRYANEAVLPFYVLHETVIVVIAYWIVRWNAHLVVKYFALVVASFLATLAIHDVAVRRTRISRFLFGMKPSRGRSPTSGARPGLRSPA